MVSSRRASASPASPLEPVAVAMIELSSYAHVRSPPTTETKTATQRHEDVIIVVARNRARMTNASGSAKSIMSNIA
jgi:hypothetical protein